MFHWCFLQISSYDLAKRRLSLPISTLSTVEQIWNGSINMMFEDSDDTDNVSVETPIKVSPVNTTYKYSSVGLSGNMPSTYLRTGIMWKRDCWSLWSILQQFSGSERLYVGTSFCVNVNFLWFRYYKDY
jgi:hypothetical protein